MIKALLTVGLLAASASAFSANLLTVYHQAVTNSPALNADLNTAKASKAGANAAGGTYLPQLSLSAEANFNHATGGTGNYATQDALFTLSQSLFNVADLGSWRSLQQTSLSQHATYRYQRQDFMVNTVAKDYFNVLEAQDNVKFDEAKLSYLKKTLDQTRAKFKVGMAVLSDLRQAEADYDQATATYIKDDNDLKKAQIVVSVLTGQDYKFLAALKPDLNLVPPLPDNMAYWVRISKANNKNLHAAQLAAASSRDAVLAAAGTSLPSVALVGTADLDHNNNPGAAGYNETHNRNLTVALQLTWNILAGGSQLAATAQATHTYEAAEATRDNTFRTTVEGVRKSFLAVKADIIQVNAYRASIVASTASLKQYQARYRVGTETIANVLQQLENLYSAQRNYTQALYQYMTDQLQLRLDSGTLSLTDLTHINDMLQSAYA
jgi:outer membrane protein